MMMLNKLLFLSFMAIISIVASSQGHEDDIYTIELNKDNFDTEIKEKSYFVMFFAPWCGHCQRLAPTWEELAETYNKKDDAEVFIAKVDCTISQDLCSKQDVTGYPTLKFFKVGVKESIKFRGIRDLTALTNFIKESLAVTANPEADEITESPNVEVPKAVENYFELTDETFPKHVAEGAHFIKFYAPWCSHCQKLAPTWEVLAKDFENDKSVSVSKIDCTQYRPICQEYEVKGYPTLLWIEGGKKIEKYSGARTHEALKTYVDKMLGNELNTPTPDNLEPADGKNSVMILDPKNFHDAIETGVTFVKFYAPWCGHCKRLAPIWDKLANKFTQTTVKIAKMDCSTNAAKTLCQNENIDGFPTLMIYKNGLRVTEYNGARDLDELYHFVQRYSAHEEL